MADERKDTNPKDALGDDKIPFHLVPDTAVLLCAMAMLDGGGKYGRSNWMPMGAKASVYHSALRRHIARWWAGEDIDPDSGLPHLGHIMACAAILIDAEANGNLVDDRSYPGGYIKLVEKMTPHVKRIKEKHKDKNPKHWTKLDAPKEA
jgi:Domain of unknown function (DUF5664)